MEIINAKIQQTQFVVLSSTIKTTMVRSGDSVKINDVPIDIDYEILTNKKLGPHVVRVVMTIKGNNTESIRGYVFELRVGAEYRLSKDIDPASSEYFGLIHYSAVPCVINESRAFLQAQTAFFPFNSYIMPMISVEDLVKSKNASQKTNSAQDDKKRKNPIAKKGISEV